jgi:hypothetical protein
LRGADRFGGDVEELTRMGLGDAGDVWVGKVVVPEQGGVKVAATLVVENVIIGASAAF